MSSSLKFLSGLAALIASFTACFSVSVNAVLFSTLTGSSGGLKLFTTSFCSTVSDGLNSLVLPSLLTVAVPSFSTLISAAVKPASGFAFIIAAITASFSPDVSDVKSPTGVLSGLVKVSSASAFFSQTAYTVFGDVMFVKSVTFAVVASFESAQPLKV